MKMKSRLIGAGCYRGRWCEWDLLWDSFLDFPCFNAMVTRFICPPYSKLGAPRPSPLARHLPIEPGLSGTPPCR